MVGENEEVCDDSEDVIVRIITMRKASTLRQTRCTECGSQK